MQVWGKGGSGEKALSSGLWGPVGLTLQSLTLEGPVCVSWRALLADLCTGVQVWGGGGGAAERKALSSAGACCKGLALHQR
jgi:hypothetical protein